MPAAERLVVTMLVPPPPPPPPQIGAVAEDASKPPAESMVGRMLDKSKELMQCKAVEKRLISLNDNLTRAPALPPPSTLPLCMGLADSPRTGGRRAGPATRTPPLLPRREAIGDVTFDLSIDNRDAVLDRMDAFAAAVRAADCPRTGRGPALAPSGPPPPHLFGRRPAVRNPAAGGAQAAKDRTELMALLVDQARLLCKDSPFVPTARA